MEKRARYSSRFQTGELYSRPRVFISYTGNYTFDGDALSTRVDAASDASRVGGDQLRKVRFENGGMVLAPPRRLFANVMQHQELFWERVAER